MITILLKCPCLILTLIMVTVVNININHLTYWWHWLSFYRWGSSYTLIKQLQIQTRFQQFIYLTLVSRFGVWFLVSVLTALQIIGWVIGSSITSQHSPVVPMLHNMLRLKQNRFAYALFIHFQQLWTCYVMSVLLKIFVVGNWPNVV